MRPGAKASGGPVASPGGSPSPAARASAERAYLAELQRAIARQQRFPEEARRRRVTGVATLAFVVQADGRIGQVRVVGSSGDSALDQAAVQALSRLGRFKPIPSSIGRSSWPMRVPIRFDLR
jgi:protein TonB